MERSDIRDKSFRKLQRPRISLSLNPGYMLHATGPPYTTISLTCFARAAHAPIRNARSVPVDT